MRCASCEFENPDANRFCGGCGAALNRTCAACASDNPPGFRFCGECGNPLLAEPNPASTERRHITVMFCDLVDSTQLSESVDPEEYLAIIRAYQGAVAQTVDRWDGHIAQYLGDGVLVYFGFRKAREDDAVRAVRCALDIVVAVEQLSEDLERRYGTRVRTRTGVHTGVVVAGSIGTGQRVDQLALGSTPNVAARVQGLASPDQVLITGATHEIVQRVLRAEPFGTHALKGVAEPVPVYAVRGIRSPDEQGRDTQFVGRRHELSLLLECFAATRDGNGQLVVVRGEAGIGKSRLLSEFKKQAGQMGQWLIARCSGYHENVDLYPLAEMLKRRVGLAEGMDDATQLAELERWVRGQSALHDEGDAARHFAAIMGLAGGRGVNRQDAFDTVLRWMRRAADAQPLIFSVEDAHWADPSTLDFLACAAEHLVDSRVLVIINTRPSFEPHWPTQNNQRNLEVSRIGTADAQAFIESCFDEPVPRALVRQLIDRADGVPLYLEELAAAVRRDAVDDIDIEHFVPHSLQDSLLARIDALGPAREIAQIGALLGRSFSMRMLMAASRSDEATLQDWVQRVVDSGLLQRLGAGPGATLRFRHSLIQDTAYETLLKSQRKALHGQVADAIQRSFPELAESEPQTLARHWEGAGLVEPAVRAYLTAAARANHRAALVEAVRIYRKAQSLLGDLPAGEARDEIERELLFGLAQPISGQGGYGDRELRPIIDRLTELTTNRVSQADHYPALSTAFAYHSMRGHTEESRRCAQACLDCAERSGKRGLMVHAMFAVGSTHFYCGELESARARLAEGIALAERDHAFGDVRRDLDGAPLLCRIVQSWCLSLLGLPDQASSLAEETLRAARAHEAAFAEVQVLAWALYGDWDMRRPFDVIQARAEALIAVAEEHDMARWLTFARNTRNWALYAQGDDAAYDADTTRAMLEPDAIGVTSGYNVTRVIDVLIGRGDLETASEFVSRVQTLVETSLGCGHAPEVGAARKASSRRCETMATRQMRTSSVR